MVRITEFTKIGSNMKTTMVKGFPVLYSYTTPVAGRDEKGEFRSKTYYKNQTSKTTERQINKWFSCDSKNQIGRIVSQDYLENLMDGV